MESADLRSMHKSDLIEKVSSLDAINTSLGAINASLTEQLAAKDAMLLSFGTRIEKLEHLVELYQDRLSAASRNLFGSKSEASTLNPAQLLMFEQVAFDPPPVETETISYERPKKQKGKRELDLSGLRKEYIDYEIPEDERACPECGETMTEIGTEESHHLVRIPAEIIDRIDRTHTYGCPCCRNNSDHTPIVKAETPPALIPGSLASASLLANIIFQKYVNGTPIYRLESGFTYEGTVISRQTMCNWIIQCSQMYLEPVYKLLISLLLKESVIHGDETTVQVLREAGRRAQTKSYEWVYRTGVYAERQIAVYIYKQTRNHENPKEFLKDYEGYFHCDGYGGYHKLPDKIVIVGCWFHLRQYFEKAYKKIPEAHRKGTPEETGMGYINALFKLERKYESLAPDERTQKRLEESKPIADDFFAWAESVSAPSKSLFGQALTYAMNQRKYLENVYRDGRLEISNNRAERTVKSFVIGRKNFLFSTSVAGAEANSVLYTIVETAKANGLNPERYVEYLLEQLPSMKTSDLESILPWSESLPDICRVPVAKTSLA